jgi:hypothetical protein
MAILAMLAIFVYTLSFSLSFFLPYAYTKVAKVAKYATPYSLAIFMAILEATTMSIDL